MVEYRPHLGAVLNAICSGLKRRPSNKYMSIPQFTIGLELDTQMIEARPYIIISYFPHVEVTSLDSRLLSMSVQRCVKR
jgi:hypothetical protein